jgi:glycerophosphoryl diester phosphodiesterase
LWPENSLAAFAGALDLGIDLLELDVHLSADAEVVVIHDATLERTTEGTGAVGTQAAAALRRLRLRGPDGALTDERIPLLDDVLALAARAGADMLVEIKGPQWSVRYAPGAGAADFVAGPTYAGLEERVLARLDEAGMAGRATLMAFNPAVLARFRTLAPARRATLLVGRRNLEQAGARPEDTVQWAAGLGVTDLGLEHTLIAEPVVAAARARAILLGAWTVNDEQALRRLAALGVDVITTDRPDLAVRVREALP